MAAVGLERGAQVLETIVSTYGLDPKELVHHVVENVVTGGIWVWAPELNLEWYDRRFLELLGLRPEDTDYTPEVWQRRIDSADLVRARDAYHRLTESRGSEPYDLIVTYWRPDGNSIRVRCQGEVLRWKGSSPLVMVGRHVVVRPGQEEGVVDYGLGRVVDRGRSDGESDLPSGVGA